MKLFVDTSAWLALNDKNDQYHQQAVERSLDIKRQRIELITSEYIVDESITIIRYRISHQAAVMFGDSLFNSNIVRIYDVTQERRPAAWELFKKYGDKDLSFTDCTSFALMKGLAIKKAFTFDAHFKKMGFEMF